MHPALLDAGAGDKRRAEPRRTPACYAIGASVIEIVPGAQLKPQ